jgi:hypothetical protein
MSETIIYAVKDGENPRIVGTCRNAFRSAMYVWKDIAVRYFDLESFPHFDTGMQHRIWNAGNEKPLTQTEKIVLASTMDRATVSLNNLAPLVAAFEEYGAEHPGSSIGEQALLLKNLIPPESEPDSGRLIAWQQTSVGEFWASEYDEDTEEYTACLGDYFDVVEQVCASNEGEDHEQ